VPPEAARLLLPAGPNLPDWCDRYLAPPDAGDFFASRAWYETTISHALPGAAQPLLARDPAALMLLLRERGGIRALTTPYTLVWRPLPASASTADALRAAGRALARAIGFGPPVRLDALDDAAAGVAPLLAGFAAAGRIGLRYAHFGNWHAALPPELTWNAYLDARPPQLRTTIARKLNRARRTLRFELATAPGTVLEAGIDAYEDVRARSWKPHEPFPAFDRALMRAAASAAVLRLGVLRAADTGRPVAAQYWIVSAGKAAVLKLAHAEDARDASPGTVLTAMMIRRLIEDEQVSALDFGRGDDPYKRQWVEHRRQRIGVLLVDPRHPAGIAALARHAAGRLRGRLLAWRGENPPAQDPA
jgi:hypothetical protein